MSRVLTGIVVALAVALGVMYFQQNRTLKDNSVLKGNQVVLEQVNKDSAQTIEKLTAQYEKIEQNYNALQDEFRVVSMQRDELIEKFGRHDLGLLAKAKPKLVENIINSATADANRCFEILTGSPLKAGEKNNECPWLMEK